MSTVNPNRVLLAAADIGKCDFRTTVSKYITAADCPWIITVGETKWQRHIVVEEIAEDGSDATLGILSPDQSNKFGYDINTEDVAVRIRLTDLIRNGYVGVKNLLHPQVQAA